MMTVWMKKEYNLFCNSSRGSRFCLDQTRIIKACVFDTTFEVGKGCDKGVIR